MKPYYSLILTVNIIPVVTPKTTIYTPISKIKGVPIYPIIGKLNVPHIPVNPGFPKNNEKIPLHNAINKPEIIKTFGFKGKILLALTIPFEIVNKANAIDATNPPTNPPPGS